MILGRASVKLLTIYTPYRVPDESGNPANVALTAATPARIVEEV
jgi:hypothetical protein